MRIDRDRVAELLEVADSAATTTAAGTALENVVRVLLEAIPGVEFEGSKVLDATRSQEIDVVFRNHQDPNGLQHLPHLIFVECKHWLSPADSEAVSRFIWKLESRGETFGVIVSRHRITGLNREGPRSAYIEVLTGLARGVTVVVLDERELKGVRSGGRLARVLMEKFRQLKVRRELYAATDEDLNRPEFARGIAAAIKQVRQSVIREFFEATTSTDSLAASLGAVRRALEQLEESARVQSDEDDPMWHLPRATAVVLGGTLVDLLEHADEHEWTVETLDITARINGPSRLRAWAGGELWGHLTGFYLRQLAEPTDIDRLSATLALLEMTIEHVEAIDSIDPSDFIDD